jgi:tetratricopeptide (TPR) repeat protein
MSQDRPTNPIADGEARLAEGDLDGALEAFRRAVAAAPASAVAHSKLGIVYVHQQQLEAAAAEFTKAIQLDPTYAPAYSNLGNVYRERGQLDQAIAQYQKAVSMDPDYWIAHQNLGIVYKQQGRIGDAVREFKTATRISLRAPGRHAPAPPRGGGGRLGCLGTSAAMILAAILALKR